MRVKVLKVSELRPYPEVPIFSTECPDSGIIVATADNEVIFGYEKISHAPQDAEVEVLCLGADCDPKRVALGMYSAGRLATFDWKKVCENDPESFGFGPLIWTDTAIEHYAASIQNVARVGSRKLF